METKDSGQRVICGTPIRETLAINVLHRDILELE